MCLFLVESLISDAPFKDEANFYAKLLVFYMLVVRRQ